MSSAAVVLGADVEGLTAAVTLARGGRRVIVIEEQERAGGCLAREEFAPGYFAPGVLHEAGCVRRELLAGLDLASHGLRWDAHDAANCPASLLVERVRPWLAAVLDEAPPELEGPTPLTLWQVARHALGLRLLGERDMLELLRVFTLPITDFFAEHGVEESARVPLAAPALCGTVLGPRAPGTAALWLLRECARGPEPTGGPAALVDALLLACQAAGVELQLGAPLAAIRVERGAVRGVTLADGELCDAELVLSALGPKRTFLELLPPRHVAPRLEHAARTWRTRGALAVFRLALSQAPQLERTTSARSLVELERCADHLKYGTLPDEPWVDVRVSAGTGVAPAGHAVLTALVHGIPHDLRGGWDAGARQRLERGAWRALERLVPDLRQRVVGAELLSPPDLEQRYGLAGGHVFGGELALDQLWIQRPAPFLARYATPVAGLFLCGASSHPGGPFLGGAGALAAQAAGKSLVKT